jgi:uncharacterized protein YecT (DUF1311 family)
MNSSAIRILLLTALLSLLFACARQAEPERQPGSAENETPPLRIVPGEWKPALDQVRSDLTDQIEQNASQNQLALNRAGQNLADVIDAEAFIAYVQLMERLDAAGRAELFNEQQQWLEKRRTDADAGVQSKGGSLAAAEYSGAFRKITEARLAELRKRLAERGAAESQNKEK